MPPAGVINDPRIGEESRNGPARRGVARLAPRGAEPITPILEETVMFHRSTRAQRRIAAAIGVLALGSSLAFTGAAVQVGASGENRSVAAVPAAFEQYLVYLSEPGAGAFEPVTYEEFLAFQHDVYGRDADAVDAFRAEAIAFYRDTFGLDFSAADVDEEGVQAIDGARLSPSFVRPERNYQAHTVGGEWVPSSGWDVRDSSFNVTITDPDVLLHGTYGGEEGKPAAEGALLAFGDYSVAVDRPGNSDKATGRGGEEIRIRFMSSSPITADEDGIMTFVCNLTSDDWGSGQARGIVTPDGGIRNVLTFPASLN